MADLVLPKSGDRVLSLWQPWASLIALRVKRIETRGWSTSYRGPLWIHAAKRYPTLDDMLVVAANETAWNAWHASGLVADDGEIDPGPLGAIVARVDLVDVLPMVDVVGAEHQTGAYVEVAAPYLGLWRPGAPVLARIDDERAYGIYEPGRFAWLMEDVQALDEPIPMRGRQQIWRIPEGVAANG
ncbi:MULTISPECIES: hypothetical protein [unclassified Egicoccus]|uniref:hypothetical protein n=1 Tax=unclassified Egicoccus TaxID=2635606 RepID=UPI00359EB036